MKPEPNEEPRRREDRPELATNRPTQPDRAKHSPDIPEEHDEDEASEGAPVNDPVNKHQ